MTPKAMKEAQERARGFLKEAGVVLTDEEAERIEIAHLGLGELEQTGLELITYVNTDRVCAKELVLFPRQTCPEHKHPPIDGEPGKEETFRCRWGEVYLYVEGPPIDPAQAKARPPAHRTPYYTVWHEIILRPGDQYTIPPDTWHWFQGGDDGAVVSEFSTRSRDDFDSFRDPDIRRIPELDRAMSTRPPVEHVNIENPCQVRAYLVRTGRLHPRTSFSLEKLSGGVSARTVLVHHGSGPGWVIKQALSKLRVAAEWYCDPGRIHHEAAGLRWLGRVLPPGATPRFLFEDMEHHLLAMEAVAQPHRNWKEMLLDGELEDEHVHQFATLLTQLHGAASPQGGAMEKAFSDRTFFESLRIEPYYGYTASQVPPASAFLDALVTETRAVQLTLVHGDYSPKNVLISNDRLVLLDHEVIHLGDPAFDIGFSLTHLLSKAHHLSAQREDYRRAALLYWNTYKHGIEGARWQHGLERRAVRHTVGCLLARAAGRSPLEYLSHAERARQRAISIALITNSCTSIPELVDAFLSRLQS